MLVSEKLEALREYQTELETSLVVDQHEFGEGEAEEVQEELDNVIQEITELENHSPDEEIE